MQVHLCAKSKNRRVKAAWLSLQPDGSISFGLTDKTFVAPKFMGRFGVFNLYNQVEAAFLIRGDSVGLRKITEPHFTFHPPTLFHLTGKDRNHSIEVFRGINDVELTVSQHGHLRWLRAISPPMSQMKTYGARNDNLRTTVLTADVESEELTIGVSLDFVKPGVVDGQVADTVRFIDHGAIRIRCEISVHPLQIPTLAWFHSH